MDKGGKEVRQHYYLKVRYYNYVEDRDEVVKIMNDINLDAFKSLRHLRKGFDYIVQRETKLHENGSKYAYKYIKMIVLQFDDTERIIDEIAFNKSIK